MAQYEKRDAAFTQWLGENVDRVHLDLVPSGPHGVDDALREAFNAGWDAKQEAEDKWVRDNLFAGRA